MFIVINKSKIYSYIIAISMVFVLFAVATNVNVANLQNSIATSATTKELPIYNVVTNDNKIALTMNCAWSQLPMGQKIKSLYFKCLKDSKMSILFL